MKPSKPPEIKVNVGDDIVLIRNPTEIQVPMECPKCKVEFWTLMSAGGNGYCERCHFQTLYDRIEQLEKK